MEATRLVRRLLARVIEDLVLDHPAGELVLVPGELGEDERVERALVADPGVAVHRVCAGRLRAMRLEHAREELE